MKPWVHLVVAAAFIVSSCSTGLAGSVGPAAGADPGWSQERIAPPPLIVRSDAGEEIRVQPFAYCWAARTVSLCADGDPWFFGSPTLEGDASFSLEWPLAGWTWTVEARSRGDQCDVPLPRLTNQAPNTPIAAPAVGDLVFVTGRGPQGDASFAFDPAFVSGGGLPDVSATLSFARPDASPVDARGLSIRVANLPDEPADFAASVFVEDVDGRVGQFELEPHQGDCWFGIVSASVDPEAHGVALAGFRVPISLTADLVLDGAAYRSEEIVWPDAFRTNSDQSPDLILNPVRP